MYGVDYYCLHNNFFVISLRSFIKLEKEGPTLWDGGIKLERLLLFGLVGGVSRSQSLHGMMAPWYSVQLIQVRAANEI